MGLLFYNKQNQHWLQNYNCAGFALGTFGWYQPPTWEYSQYDWELVGRMSRWDVLGFFLLMESSQIFPTNSY